MKKYFERRLKHLSLIILFIIFLIVSIVECLKISERNKSDFERLINKIWLETVRTDCYNRLGKSGEFFLQGKTNTSLSPTVSIQTEDTTIMMDKNRMSQSEDEIVKHDKALQTALLKQNYPVRVNQLDSIFRDFLEKDGFNNLKVSSCYYDIDGHLVDSSKIDISFGTKVMATNEIKTGLFDEITLRGYVVLPIFYFIKSAKLFYIGWLCTVIFVSFIFLRLFQKKKISVNKEVILSETPPLEEETIQDNILDKSPELSYDSVTRTLTYGTQSVGLTSLSGHLFLSLLQASGRTMEYDAIISALWPDGSGEKARLEQHCYILRRKLKEISELDISIETLSGIGYILHIPEGTEVFMK